MARWCFESRKTEFHIVSCSEMLFISARKNARLEDPVQY